VLGGLTIYPPVANFLQYTAIKNYGSWFAIIKQLTFLSHPVCTGADIKALIYNSEAWVVNCV